MTTKTSIAWAEKTWGVVLGCEQVSDGCRICYAIKTANRLSHNPHPKIGPLYQGLTEKTEAGLDWTGVVRTVPERLGDPFTWRKPTKVFVNSQSDLFHTDVPEEFIAEVWAVMAANPQHIFQILTKRHARMRSLLNSEEFDLAVADAWSRLNVTAGSVDGDLTPPYPLPNVHLGVSVEDQQWADIRIPALLATPAAVRWISAEPLLGTVDLKRWVWGNRCPDPQCSDSTWDHDCELGPQRLHWLVVGGESGPGARPMDIEWARSLRGQCSRAGVPFFFKQYGLATARQLGLRSKGEDPEEWPEVWPREYPEAS